MHHRHCDRPHAAAAHARPFAGALTQQIEKDERCAAQASPRVGQRPLVCSAARTPSPGRLTRVPHATRARIAAAAPPPASAVRAASPSSVASAGPPAASNSLPPSPLPSPLPRLARRALDAKLAALEAAEGCELRPAPPRERSAAEAAAEAAGRLPPGHVPSAPPTGRLLWSRLAPGYVASSSAWGVSSRDDYVAPDAEALAGVPTRHRRTKDAVSLHAEAEHKFKARSRVGSGGGAGGRSVDHARARHS